MFQELLHQLLGIATDESLQQALECVAEDRTQRITRDDVAGQLRSDCALSSIRQDARFRQLLARN